MLEEVACEFLDIFSYWILYTKLQSHPESELSKKTSLGRLFADAYTRKLSWSQFIIPYYSSESLEEAGKLNANNLYVLAAKFLPSKPPLKGFPVMDSEKMKQNLPFLRPLIEQFPHILPLILSLTMMGAYPDDISKYILEQYMQADPEVLLQNITFLKMLQ